MKTILFAITIFIGSTLLKAQDVEGQEFGIDATFYASTNSGSFGLGLKYGIRNESNIIYGPSIRYQRDWTNNSTTGFKSGINIFGGGAFIHARFFDYFFVGSEFEMLTSPYPNTGNVLLTKNNWIPTLLLGGGISMNLSESVRINVGLMYDIIDRPASPLRTQYFIRTKTIPPDLLPIIYRFAFFFDI